MHAAGALYYNHRTVMKKEAQRLAQRKTPPSPPPGARTQHDLEAPEPPVFATPPPAPYAGEAQGY